jgi:membrane fusion protein
VPVMWLGWNHYRFFFRPDSFNEGVRMPGLFRKKVVDVESMRLVGAVSLAQPLSLSVTIFFLVTMVAAVVVYLSYSSYTRKESVQGYLRPDKDLVKSYSDRNGIVEKIHVTEGGLVNRGDPLVTIVTRLHQISGEDLSVKLIEEFNQQLITLDGEHRENDLLKEQESIRLSKRISLLKKADSVVVRQKALLSKKVELLSGQLRLQDKLFSDGYASTTEYQAQEHLLDVRQEVESIESIALKQRDDLAQLEFEFSTLEQRFKLGASDIVQRKSRIVLQLSQTKNQRRYVIEASHSGVVNAIQVDQGQSVSTSQSLLSLIPQGAELIAELMLPTRSAGYVKRGDIARLRFDAFPYHRFGGVSSAIVDIDKSFLLRRPGTLLLKLNEPAYRLQSRLRQQFITAYGEQYPLKSGMLVQADIVLDKRTLMQWFLDPIYRPKRRID